MNYLIYCSISNTGTREGMLTMIKSMSEKMCFWNCIIKVENSPPFESTSKNMCECICDFLSTRILDKEDEVYMYYWSPEVTGAWQLKKKGCQRTKLAFNNLPRLDISLGAKLGILR
jgi:hypothetical protein